MKESYWLVDKGPFTFVTYPIFGQAVEACTTTRCNLGLSGCNLYKPFRLAEGQKDFREICKTLGIRPENVATNRLLDSTNKVRKVEEANADIFDGEATPRADGLITNRRGLVLYLYASDCAIVFLYDPVHQAIGLCHAGWRGTVNGIIKNTVQEMSAAYGTDPSDLLVAIGPTVSQPFCSLTANEAEQFKGAGFANYIDHRPGRYAELRANNCLDDSPWPAQSEIPDYYADLIGADTEILMSSGVKTENISITGLCAYQEADLFYSYFRGPIDKQGYHRSGVNGSFLWLPA